MHSLYVLKIHYNVLIDTNNVPNREKDLNRQFKINKMISRNIFKRLAYTKIDRPMKW